MPHKILAFTLLELLSTLAIITILTSIALPTYTTLIERQRTINLLTQLHTELHYARDTAVNLQQPVSLCAGNSTCATERVWTQQILTFVDSNLNGFLDADEQLLKVADLPSSHSWSWSNFRQQPYMTYTASGMTNSLNGTFTLCHETQALASLTLNRSGRVRRSLFNEPETCPQ